MNNKTTAKASKLLYSTPLAKSGAATPAPVKGELPNPESPNNPTIATIDTKTTPAKTFLSLAILLTKLQTI